ncbi:uncharacterized protein [Atheta coriaria]
MGGVAIALWIAACPVYVILMCYESLRYNTPISFLLIISIWTMWSGAVLCIATIEEDMFWLPSLTIAIVTTIISGACFFTFLLDVGNWFMHILNILINGCILIAVLMHFYLSEKTALIHLILTPILYVMFSVACALQTIHLLQNTNDLELQKNDYLLGLVLLETYAGSCRKCCQTE